MSAVDERAQSQGATVMSRVHVGRWLLGALLFLSMGIGGAWGVYQLGRPDVLPLRVVRIDGGLKHLDRSTLETAVGRVVTGNFFTVDVDAVRSAASSLAWVDRVSVRRVWPDTLLMRVVEQRPLARWGDGAMLNERGEIFRPAVEGVIEGLPLLAGPDETAAALARRYRQLSARFADLGLEVVRMDMDRRRALSVVFRQGLALQVGSVDVVGRVDRFISAYPHLAKALVGGRLVRVDLRYANGLSVYAEPLDDLQGEDVLEHRGQV
ncbi:MAG: FtsQ-type POTRA domain-containing protein [gamma proteobacterium symbiont of Phacoides pectinatus]